MRIGKHSLRIVAVSLCLASAVSLAGCSDGGGQPSTQPQPPASSSGTSAGAGSGDQQGSSSASSKTPEEQQKDYIHQNVYHPANEQGSWVRKDGYVFVARVSESGRLYDGQWYEEQKVLSSMSDALAVYPNASATGRKAFLSVPDDSLMGTNCVWDGKNLNYYPTNVNDKNTYMYKSGLVYEACVSPDGYLFGGNWVDEGTQRKAHYQYFKSFPYNETGAIGYRWNGSSLTYEASHVVSSSDVMTYSQMEEYVSGNKYDGAAVMVAKLDGNGRIVDAGGGWCSVRGSKEDTEAWYRDHGYDTFFYEFPIYGSATDYIWNGSTFTYSPVKK